VKKKIVYENMMGCDIEEEELKARIEVPRLGQITE
jgi:hypothetical protein